jgi:hypothetical protein
VVPDHYIDHIKPQSTSENASLKMVTPLIKCLAFSPGFVVVLDHFIDHIKPQSTSSPL